MEMGSSDLIKPMVWLGLLSSIHSTWASFLWLWILHSTLEPSMFWVLWALVCLSRKGILPLLLAGQSPSLQISANGSSRKPFFHCLLSLQKITITSAFKWSDFILSKRTLSMCEINTYCNSGLKAIPTKYAEGLPVWCGPGSMHGSAKGLVTTLCSEMRVVFLAPAWSWYKGAHWGRNWGSRDSHNGTQLHPAQTAGSTQVLWRV